MEDRSGRLFPAVRRWGVGCGLAVIALGAFQSALPTGFGSSGATVYADPRTRLFGEVLLTIAGSLAIGLGAFLWARDDDLVRPRLAAVTVSWAVAFACAFWFWRPIGDGVDRLVRGPSPAVNDVAWPPPNRHVEYRSDGTTVTTAFAVSSSSNPMVDALRGFALIFGFVGGGLSMFLAVRTRPVLATGGALAAGVAWAGGSWIAASALVPVWYLLLFPLGLVIQPMQRLVPSAAGVVGGTAMLVACAGAGLVCGSLAATCGIPVQRWLLRQLPRALETGS